MTPQNLTTLGVLLLGLSLNCFGLVQVSHTKQIKELKNEIHLIKEKMKDLT